MRIVTTLTTWCNNHAIATTYDCTGGRRVHCVTCPKHWNFHEYRGPTTLHIFKGRCIHLFTLYLCFQVHFCLFSAINQLFIPFTNPLLYLHTGFATLSVQLCFSIPLHFIFSLFLSKTHIRPLNCKYLQISYIFVYFAFPLSSFLQQSLTFCCKARPFTARIYCYILVSLFLCSSPRRPPLADTNCKTYTVHRPRSADVVQRIVHADLA